METFQTHKENRIPSVLTESYCLATGEFCGPSHEVDFEKRDFTLVIYSFSSHLSYSTLISVRTNDDFA